MNQTDGITWSLTASGARVRLPAGYLDDPRHASLELACEHFEHAGLLQSDREGASFSFEQWAAIGRSNEHLADEEERDEATTRRAALATLARDDHRFRVRLVGLWGRHGSRLLLQADGVEVQLDSGWPHAAGRPLWLTPQGAALVAALRDYNAATTDSARVEAGLPVRRLCSEAGDAIDVPASIPREQVVHAKALQIGVEDAALADGSVSVVANVVADDGTTRVTSRNLHPSGAFVETAKGTRVQLSGVQRAALRQLAGMKGLARADLGAAQEHPEWLLGPDAIDETLQFSGYSARVRGFVETVKPALEIAPSGIAWFLESDRHGASDVFMVLHFRDDSGALEEVRIATLDDAQLAYDELQSEMQTFTQPCRWRGITLADPLAVLTTLEARLGGAEAGERRRRLAAELQEVPASVAVRTTWREPDLSVLTSLLADDMKLLPHQREGLRWLWTRYCAAADVGGIRGVVLADDMGLGKTFQIACLMALARVVDHKPVPHLVVAPKVLLDNWRKELARYFPRETLRTRIVAASDLRAGHGFLVDATGRILEQHLHGDDVWLLSYDTLQMYGPALLRPEWHVVVLDEAQAIKNPATASSRNARGLKARFSIGSTGTPIENKSADLFAIADFACPTVLGSSPHDFDAQFPADDEATPKRLRQSLAVGDGPEALLLRREKSVVLRDLPPKETRVVRVAMSDAQRSLERDLVGTRTNGGALELLGKLQKLYQHPLLLDAADGLDRASLDELLEQSPKLRWLRDTIAEIARRREKVLIFTVWTRMQSLIMRLLVSDHAAAFLGRRCIINGDPQNMKSAHARIDAFTRSVGFDALILSPLAAGTGLTITAATHVIHYGRWWNPAREDQATDRAHRIGQTRPVKVWIPVLHHPNDPHAGFDVGLHELVERKRAIARDFLAPAQLDISAGELHALAGEER